MATRQASFQGDAAALRKVSAELDELLSARRLIGLTEAEQERYQALCQREQDLLNQTEPTPDTEA